MPRTIQQFNDEFQRIKNSIREAEKERTVLFSQAENLFDKNKIKTPDPKSIEDFLSGTLNASPEQKSVWNKLSPQARRNYTPESIEMFGLLHFGNLDYYIPGGDVQEWWRGKFNDGRKTFYDAWGRGDTWGINGYGYGNFRNIEERNTYMVGALYADNFISSISSPFLNVEQISGDGIANRANKHYVDAYNILKSGTHNALIIRSLANIPEKIVYLNDTQEAEDLQKRYKKNSDLLDSLHEEQEALEREKSFIKPEKLELINQYNRISGAIDNLGLKITKLEQNQKAQKNLTDSFFKGSGKRMSMRDELMSQSESLQSDISKLSLSFNLEKERNKKAINSINTELSGFNKKFKDLKDLYSVNESKLKEDSNLIKEDVIILQASNTNLNKKVFVIQKEMDENSKNYALEKEKIIEEIEGLRKKGDDFLPAINNLNTKLVNLTKAHDLTKNKLLDNMKSLERFNQTQFDEIKNKNEDFKKRYNKDTEQLQRELIFVRSGMDARDRDINHLADEVAQSRDAYVELKKQSNVKFKTLFDYNEYTNRQIRKQDTKKLTTLGNIKKAAQPDLLKKAFAGIVRGRFFDAQPILY